MYNTNILADEGMNDDGDHIFHMYDAHTYM